MLDGTHYFECTCSAPTHTLRFVLDKDEKFPTIYTEIMMSHYLPWYKRLWVGIKYVVAMDTPDHFGCWELHPDDADTLIDMLLEFKQVDATSAKLLNRKPK